MHLLCRLQAIGRAVEHRHQAVAQGLDQFAAASRHRPCQCIDSVRHHRCGFSVAQAAIERCATPQVGEQNCPFSNARHASQFNRENVTIGQRG